MLFTGCAETAGAVRTPAGAKNVPRGAAPIRAALAQKPEPVPEVALVGKVVMANPTARFVVLSFPVGQMPAVDQHFDVYRAGSKVGELKVGAWRRDDSVVGDIITGDCQSGDEAWAK